MAVSIVRQILNLLSEKDESSSTSSDSSSEDDSNNMAVITCLFNSQPNHQRCIEMFNAYGEEDFWRHFRMSRGTFKKILTYLENTNFRGDVIYHGGFHPMSTREMLFILLWYLGSQCSINTMCEVFGRTASSVWLAIGELCKFFFEKQSDFIVWPPTSEIPKIAKEFEKIAGFPGVVGAIDGCHFKIHPPEVGCKAYTNSKQSCSLNVIAVALADHTFSYAFTGFPGSCHDARVFQHSSLYSKLEGFNDVFDSSRYHLIGDPAFPPKDWLLVPYVTEQRSPLGRSQKSFNRKLFTTRRVVKNAFKVVKKRFRRCQYIHASVDRCVQIITTSFVLHNICIENGDFFRDACLNVIPGCSNNSPLSAPPPIRLSKDSGALKRTIIRKMMASNVPRVDAIIE